ncbi:DUF3889 domain-containing protein [Paenibacillus mucilaginosus]|uniref:TolB domain protein n=1 Tax=Paenibacillus mucilaginosus (strain KNP414) TaxID=1036673 RepID=F8F5K2_PAEMK|nr:DUF3889 domain-containing protein [Paenibacillus mucilaginosus]AEI41175.1 TolB domain protein [Paenibacillus mucilaginosus KNP414]MCG7211397.1 DUF3889 domain-containing protein [Paenibacillus mucilaginosus]WDM30225.1 DUF3889 domain-containing protein [Paenibacillus mucilaginosus]
MLHYHFKRIRTAGLAAVLLCGTWLHSTVVHGRPALPKEEPKAAFVRSGHLWLKMNGQERELTAEGLADTPRWSEDGRYVAYTRRASAEAPQSEIWVYSLETDRHEQLPVQGGANYRWSPVRSVLALQLETVLGTVEMGLSGAGSFTSEAVGVGNYAWLPDGSGFLISSAAQLNPAGWNAVELYTVALRSGAEPSKPKHLFTLPLQSEDFFAIGTSTFKWSPDRRWISFIARPTASLSADSNTLCLLSADGRTFRRLGPMLGYESWFRWAPKAEKLAYIEGEGRLVTQNKKLQIREAGAFRTGGYTPPGYADRGFTWLDDKMLAVSRSKESDWETEERLRPLPVLYRVPAAAAGPDAGQQLTSPPEGSGDFQPYYVRRSGKLTWVRSDRKEADVWIADASGAEAVPYIKGLAAGSNYYEHFDWSWALAWYDPQPAAAGRAAVQMTATFGAGVPSYAPWGRIAMQETAKKYGAEIHDYLYVGRKEAGPNLTEDTFKLWVVKGGRGFGVIVHVRWETSTEQLKSVTFEETDR